MTSVWHSYVSPLLVEFYGTFFLTLTANMAGQTVEAHNPADGLVGAADTAALAVGMVLTLLVYSGGHISGGHFNPAVTLGILLRGKIDPIRGFLYWVVQFLAGMAGASVGTYTTGELAYPSPDDIGKSLLMTILFSFLLVHTVLATATSKAVLNNQWFGLSIGMAVFVFATVSAKIPSAVNPAVASGNHFAAWCMGESQFGGQYVGTELSPNVYDGKNYWIVLVGPLIGAIIAAVWYRITSPKEFNTKKYGLPSQGHVHQNLKSSNLADILESREAGSTTEREHIRA